VRDDEIDNALLSAIGSDWMKAGLTVGWTGYKLGVRYATVAQRMQELIARGILESDRDLSEGRDWIDGRIRRSNSN
jgi:hypothetical protein